MNDNPTLVYDGECAVCIRCVAWVAKRVQRATNFEPFQSFGRLEEVGLTRHDVETAAYWVEPNARNRRHRARRGHRAAAAALRRCGGWWRVLGTVMVIPPISVVSWAGYWLVSKNRGLVGRLTR